MESLPDYFEGAFLINLPHRKDRLRAAKRELERIGWKLDTRMVQQYSAQSFHDRLGFPSIGARGCFHSHAECLKRAMASGQRHALMIEDDIAITSSLAGLSSSIIEQLDANLWDFLYLGHELTGDIPRATARTSEVRLIAPHPKTEIQTTHFYAVNGRIFSRLIAHLDRIATGPEGDDTSGPMPIDGAYNIFRRQNADVKTLIANPKLGWQRPSRSDIADIRLFDKIKSLNFVTAKLRELKHLWTSFGS